MKPSNRILIKTSLLSAASFVLLTQPVLAQVSLTGAGATFPAPIYQKWFSAYQSVGKAQINYQANGSGGGIKGVTEGTVDFGASDMPMTDEQLKDYKAKHGFDVLMLPTVLGAAVPTYNVPGVSQELNFTPEALAGIYLGTVKTWNDPAIAKANPGVQTEAAPRFAGRITSRRPAANGHLRLARTPQSIGPPA
jgi:phosphate transport system substrate-binding protein